MENIPVKTLIILAGIAQVFLVAGSFAIPKILNWQRELMRVSPLTRQIFWTYSAYILTINLCFGVLSIFVADELTDGSFLALTINGFIAVYWISRVLIQFFYYDRSSFPIGNWYSFGEIVLVTLFFSLALVYSLAFVFNLISN